VSGLSACKRKQRYADQPSAINAAAKILRSGNATYLRAYRCTYCGCYHLTNTKPATSPKDAAHA